MQGSSCRAYGLGLMVYGLELMALGFSPGMLVWCPLRVLNKLLVQGTGLAGVYTGYRV